MNRQTASEACAQVLRTSILSGERQVGDRLPPERELARTLGVTRVTVRTALAHLVAEGLIEQRQGRGTTVLDFHRATGPGLLGDVFALASANRVDVARDLLAVRRAIARPVLERVAQLRPDPSALRDAVAAFAACVRGPSPPMEELARTDLGVVEALLEMTDSTVFSLCFHPVARALLARPELGAAIYRDPPANLMGWERLLAWAADPDPSGIAFIVDILAARDAESVSVLEKSR